MRGADIGDIGRIGESSGGIQSLDAALRVLRTLADMPSAGGVSEIARACQMPVSKVHRYLASFVHAGLVQQNGRSGAYDLGPAARRLGLAALARHDVVNAACDDLARLTRETGLTSLLSVLAEGGPTVVRWERAPSPIITSFGLGTTLPVLSSATGRAFLAFTPASLLHRVIDRERGLAKTNAALLSDLPEAPTLDGRIDALRRSVRVERLARIDGRFIPGLAAAAAPILNWQGEADAVVTLIGTDPKVFGPGTATITALTAFCERHSLVPAAAARTVPPASRRRPRSA